MTLRWRHESDRAVLAGVWWECARAGVDMADWFAYPCARDADAWGAWLTTWAHAWLAFDVPTGRLGGYALATDFDGAGETCYVHFGRLPWVPVRAALRAGRGWLATELPRLGVASAYFSTEHGHAARFARALGFGVQAAGGRYYGWWQQQAAGSASAAAGGAVADGGI